MVSVIDWDEEFDVSSYQVNKLMKFRVDHSMDAKSDMNNGMAQVSSNFKLYTLRAMEGSLIWQKRSQDHRSLVRDNC